MSFMLWVGFVFFLTTWEKNLGLISWKQADKSQWNLLKEEKILWKAHILEG